MDKPEKKHINKTLLLIIYDLIILAAVDFLLLCLYEGLRKPEIHDIILHFLTQSVCVISCRYFCGTYRQIWRYGGIQSYIRLIWADMIAAILYELLNVFVLYHLVFPRFVSICCLNLLCALSIRMLYRFAYKCGGEDSFRGKVLRCLLFFFSANDVKPDEIDNRKKIRIAIVGAGRIGVMLAEELISNPGSHYYPCCFVEISKEKIGRTIQEIPVISEGSALKEELEKYGVHEVVFAIPQLGAEEKKRLYDEYSELGYRIKLYDYPLMQPGGRRHLRDFDVEELLFRKTVKVLDDATKAYYRGKVVMVTGGGGSIGSELCRQLAKMEPKQLILLDICENGVYDVQQELKIKYGTKLDVQIAIVSVANRRGLERVFSAYRPQIVVHAAAHKHVPLMEKDCVEAVENNVFGTLNTIEVSEKYGVERFIMVSTDKAVNPTNVMGATKRMCEIIARAHSESGTETTFSATRFGNVLGSAGSVIPLFRRQIANGGPVTITDKRIIRYFMTIPEASQLVLQSGAMAKNGELFVLDMGLPVKILDLAENMIRLAGMQPYTDIDIVETGLRPGEKLYEELLIHTDSLERTDNDLIFIEHDEAISMGELEERLNILREAVQNNVDIDMKDAMRKCVPTFITPESVNTVANLSAMLTK